MSTHFSVTVGINNHTVSVDDYHYKATAIILVSCLVHYKEMSRLDAIKYYQRGVKEVREGSLTMDAISVKVLEHPPKFSDLLIFPPDDTIEFWMDFGN